MEISGPFSKQHIYCTWSFSFCKLLKCSVQRKGWRWRNILKGRMQIAVIPFIQQHRKPWDVLGFGPFPSHAFICTHGLEIPLRYITREQRWCTVYGHMTSVCVRFLTSWSWAAVGLDSGFLSKAIFRKSLNSIDLKYTKPLNICTRGGYNLLCNGDKITFDSQSYSRNVKSYKSKKKATAMLTEQPIFGRNLTVMT